MDGSDATRSGRVVRTDDESDEKDATSDADRPYRGGCCPE